MIRDMFEKDLIQEHDRLGEHLSQNLIGQRVYRCRGPDRRWGNILHVAGVGYNREIEVWYEDNRVRIEGTCAFCSLKPARSSLFL